MSFLKNGQIKVVNKVERYSSYFIKNDKELIRFIKHYHRKYYSKDNLYYEKKLYEYLLEERIEFPCKVWVYSDGDFDFSTSRSSNIVLYRPRIKLKYNKDLK